MTHLTRIPYVVREHRRPDLSFVILPPGPHSTCCGVRRWRVICCWQFNNLTAEKTCLSGPYDLWAGFTLTRSGGSVFDGGSLDPSILSGVRFVERHFCQNKSAETILPDYNEWHTVGREVVMLFHRVCLRLSAWFLIYAFPHFPD